MALVSPTSGAKTEVAIDQAHMVVPNTSEEVGEAGEGDAKGGGTIFTKEFEADETRPQDLHGAVNYQKETSTTGVPKFYSYTDLTATKGTVRG